MIRRAVGLVPGLLLAAGTVACGPGEPETATGPEHRDLVTQWMDRVYGLVAVERFSPPEAARIYAYLATALHEGWVHGLEDRRSAAGALRGLDELPEPDPERSHDWPTVAATAAHGVAEHLFRHTSGSTLHALAELRDEQIERRMREGARGLEASRAYGRELAQALVEWTREDGYVETRQLAYEPPEGADKWVPTARPGSSYSMSAVDHVVEVYRDPQAERAPMEAAEWQADRFESLGRRSQATDFRFALEPRWGEVRTLAIGDRPAYEAVPPRPYSEEPGSPFHEEMMEVYRTGRDLTAEQRLIARFWEDNPGETGTPAGHWVRILTQVGDQRDLAVPETLEAGLLLATAQHDAFVVCWEDKYRYNLLRPSTAINRLVDPDWRPLVFNPPFPEYPSGHSSQSGAAAVALTLVLGEVSFTDGTHRNRHGFDERSFDSFVEAAREAARSRLYGGIHYPMANQNGLEQGERVARSAGRTILGHIRGEDFDPSEHLPERVFEVIPPEDR